MDRPSALEPPGNVERPGPYVMPDTGTAGHIDPPGGEAQMPPSTPGPTAESTETPRPVPPPMTTPPAARRFDAWNYPEDADASGAELVGYRVDALDGHIGKVDEASTRMGDSYVVVDTGPWIFGKKVMIPAGTVTRVDRENETVHVDRTKGQIKDAPPYARDTYNTPEYRNELAVFFGGQPVSDHIQQPW